MGAAWIAGRAVVPAIQASRNGRLVALACRDPKRGAEFARSHRVARLLTAYEALLEDPEVDAVYLPLVNSLHLDWTLRALAAGKHVLCEKPLALDAAQAEQMASAAVTADRLLMEALMYRFHPRMVRLRESAGDVHHVHSAFSFPLAEAGNYRWRRRLGGGALLDVGSYTISVARWFLGEPDRVQAVAQLASGEDAVDLSVAAALAFPGGASATTWASFGAPEHQELTLTTERGSQRVEQPFTAWRDPDDPYQLMIEAFADAVHSSGPAPLAPADSIANLRVVDRIREAAGI